MSAKMTKSQDAVRHALERVVSNPDFRWHMMFTETLALMIVAEADRRGVGEEVVRSEILEAVEVANKHQPPAQLPTLRDRNDNLEEKVSQLQSRRRGKQAEPEKPKKMSPLEWLDKTYEEDRIRGLVGVAAE